MKIEFEPQDIETMAQRVSDILIPTLSHIQRGDGTNGSEAILDVKGLDEYLHVTASWFYNQVSLKTIPYFKAGKYPRFRKKDIDKWISGIVELSEKVGRDRLTRTRGKG